MGNENTEIRAQLLSLILPQIKHTGTAIEYIDVDDDCYTWGDLGMSANPRSRTGKPVRFWSVRDGQVSDSPYGGECSNTKFHIDEANRRVLLVLDGGFLSGGVWIFKPGETVDTMDVTPVRVS